MNGQGAEPSIFQSRVSELLSRPSCSSMSTEEAMLLAKSLSRMGHEERLVLASELDRAKHLGALIGTLRMAPGLRTDKGRMSIWLGRALDLAVAGGLSKASRLSAIRGLAPSEELLALDCAAELKAGLPKVGSSPSNSKRTL